MLRSSAPVPPSASSNGSAAVGSVAGVAPLRDDGDKFFDAEFNLEYIRFF